ncbi:MAG: methylmalonyl-CoA epimerase [Anaerolineae bacterium]|nr:methylmalonyl-CoA epimerase [Anaerolineae bacterium]
MTSIHIDHVAVVVEDIDSALGFWQQALGLECQGIKDIQEEEVQVAFLEVGESHIELVKPTTEDSGIAKYLAKRGAGMHHLCLRVNDIDAAIVQMQQADVEMINETPRVRDNGTRYAFVHPRSTGGVLVELYEKA